MNGVVDFHVHVGNIVNKTVDDLLFSMDEAKIEKSVIIAGDVVGLTNECLIEILDKHPDRFYGVVGLSFRMLKEFNKSLIFDWMFVEHTANALEHPLVLGVKFYTGYDHYFADDYKTDVVFEKLKQHNKIAIYHMGDTYCACNKTARLEFAKPLIIDNVAVKHPDVNIVIAHAGYPWHIDAAEVVYKNSNVYMDISGFVYGEFTELDKTKFLKVLEDVNFVLSNELFDSRVLFGTDFPISNQKSYIKSLSTNVNREFLTKDNLFNTFQNSNHNFLSKILSDIKHK